MTELKTVKTKQLLGFSPQSNHALFSRLFLGSQFSCTEIMMMSYLPKRPLGNHDPHHPRETLEVYIRVHRIITFD